MKRTPLWFLPLATILLAGCPLPIFESDPPIEGGHGGSGGYGDDDDDYPPPQCPPPGPGGVSPETIASVAALFRESCAHCHGNGESRGNLADIFDVDELKRRGLVRDKAEESPLFQLVDADQMPPQGALSPVTTQPIRRVTAEQKKALRDWINGGAPALRGNRNRVSIDDYQRLLRRDLSSLSRVEQGETVYVSFHAAYNSARYSNAEVSAFANATLKLLNGLDPLSTRVQRIGAGVAVIVDDQQVPLAVRFQPARFNLTRGDIDRIIASSNRQDLSNPFQCDVPVIPVVDFLQIASGDDFFNPITENFESSYSNVMLRRLFQQSGVINPNDNDTLVFNPISKADFIIGNGVGFTNVSNFTLFDVLASRGADLNELGRLFNDGTDTERFKRACLLNSGVSAANRCLDRFTLPTPANASAWLTWDSASLDTPGSEFFLANLIGPANPPQDPLVRAPGAFVADGGEVIFQLPNMMQGYTVYNGNLQLVTNSPTFAVLNSTDPERGNLMSVRACSSCHASYTIPFQDAALNVAFTGINGGVSNEEAGFLFKVVQPQENWDVQVADDSTRYLEELKDVYVTRSESGDLPDGIYNLGSQYLFDMSLDDVVAELGLLDVNALEDLIDNDTNLTTDVRSLLYSQGLSRENFTVNYQAFVDLTPSQTQDFLRACVSREVSTLGDFGDMAGDGNRSATAIVTAATPLTCAKR